MTVLLKTTGGEVLDRVEDSTNALHRILPEHNDATYWYLSCIDWYGDTTFNTLQMSRFLPEWHRVLPSARAHGSEALHQRIEALAKQCQQEVHLHLTFLGD
jgi:hypothetical protein